MVELINNKIRLIEALLLVCFVLSTLKTKCSAFIVRGD